MLGKADVGQRSFSPVDWRIVLVRLCIDGAAAEVSSRVEEWSQTAAAAAAGSDDKFRWCFVGCCTVDWVYSRFVAPAGAAALAWSAPEFDSAARPASGCLLECHASPSSWARCSADIVLKKCCCCALARRTSESIAGSPLSECPVWVDGNVRKDFWGESKESIHKLSHHQLREPNGIMTNIWTDFCYNFWSESLSNWQAQK